MRMLFIQHEESRGVTQFVSRIRLVKGLAHTMTEEQPSLRSQDRRSAAADFQLLPGRDRAPMPGSTHLRPRSDCPAPAPSPARDAATGKSDSRCLVRLLVSCKEEFTPDEYAESKLSLQPHVSQALLGDRMSCVPIIKKTTPTVRKSMSNHN